jgi:uncharacterized membrane protein YadS
MHMGHSAIFSSFIFGMVLANLPINTWKLFQTISSTEKPIYLMLLIFVGANLSFSSPIIIVVILIFIVLRFVINYFSSWLIISRFMELKPYFKTIGYAGIGMGGLSLAFGLDFYMINNYGYGKEVLFVLSIAYIVNDTFSLKILENTIIDL